MNKQSKETKKNCPSTHGGAGYTYGDYVKNGRIFCCLCKQDITDSVTFIEHLYEPYKWYENIWKWFNQERRDTGRTRSLTTEEKIKKLPYFVKNYDEN